MIAVLAVGGPGLAAAGLVYVLSGSRCDCREHVGARAVGWRLIGYGWVLVVAAWLLAPTPTLLPW